MSERSERSRKIERAILRALAKVGQAPTARALGVSETKVSRMKSEGEITRIADFLAAIDVKVVPADQRTYRPDDIASILHLARQRMEQLESPDQLAWDEDH